MSDPTWDTRLCPDPQFNIFVVLVRPVSRYRWDFDPASSSEPPFPLTLHSDLYVPCLLPNRGLWERVTRGLCW